MRDSGQYEKQRQLCERFPLERLDQAEALCNLLEHKEHAKDAIAEGALTALAVELAFERPAQCFNSLDGPTAEIGQGAGLDLTAIAIAFSQQRGWG